jgi:hypothetical protein
MIYAERENPIRATLGIIAYAIMNFPNAPARVFVAQRELHMLDIVAVVLVIVSRGHFINTVPVAAGFSLRRVIVGHAG